MKAERRHELKTNTLAHQLERLPFTLREHGNKVLLVVIGILLVIVLINFRNRATREGDQTAAQDLSTARSLIGELSNPWMSRMAPADIANEVRQSLDIVLEMADDPKLKAEALVARGDLHWTLANLPNLPSATTQASMNVEQSKPELLETAGSAYQRVLAEYPKQTMSVAAARFGLAAIAEDQGQWDQAKEHYQAIRNDAAAADAFKELAKLREEGLSVPGQGSLPGLADIRQPILLGEPATRPATTQEAADLIVPPAVPTTAPASTEPTTQPE